MQSLHVSSICKNLGYLFLFMFPEINYRRAQNTPFITFVLTAAPIPFAFPIFSAFQNFLVFFTGYFPKRISDDFLVLSSYYLKMHVLITSEKFLFLNTIHSLSLELIFEICGLLYVF